MAIHANLANKPFRNSTFATLVAAAAWLAAAGAQALQPAGAPLLREARPGEVWIAHPTIAAPPAQPIASARAVAEAVADTTPPSPPGDLAARSAGLFRISATWSAASDPESGIDSYAYAIGTGTTSDTEADVKWWQALLPSTSLNVALALTQGQTYYFSIRATNGAGLSSAVVRSDPLVATPILFGQSTNVIAYAIPATGYDESGAVAATWATDKSAELTRFLDKMMPVLSDLYGPPSSSYAVAIVRDLRYTRSAIFFPSADEIHMGDNATYQLLTHELVHAWRRDRILSSDSVWQFDATLSGFEEGFAQAVSYDAMTEFARRHPSFGLTQHIYQSSHEWDYDFQNVPELRTTDFWSDSGGMLLYWARYEVAAAAISKIQREHPAFYRAFNAEFYRRLNDSPSLTPSRALVKDVIAAVAPVIEGRPASQWIDRQYVFDCAIHPGRKIWLLTQHYPSTEYFVFNRTFFYETFSNGSDWAYPNGSGGYNYHQLNGSSGTGAVRNNGGAVVWEKSLLIEPVDNPPAYNGFGTDAINLTTQATNLPWPGGDPTTFATSLLSLGLYELSVQFTGGATTTSNAFHRVIGGQLRNTAGVFGGIAGAGGGRIHLNHRNHPPEPPIPVVNGGFWAARRWASVAHPATDSNDSDPGLVDVTYIDAAGNVYTDVRAIGYGSSSGNQAFLFDVSRMTAGAFGAMAASRPSLRFGATKAGPTGPLTAVTAPQAVTVTFGGAASRWSATADRPWLQIASGSGSAPGRFTVSIVNSGDVIAGHASLAATITLTAPAAPNSPLVIPVALAVDQAGGAASAPPTGAFETPVHGTTGLSGSIAVTGWAVDDIDVTAVRILRDPVAGEGSSRVFIGNAAFVDGARPDVAAAFPQAPRNTRAGWGYLLLTNFLPNQGNGTFVLHAYADDADGHSILLGSKTIACDNANATRPFGAIDTPGQGETVSGTVNNFGWVLARGARRADPPGGGTVVVVVDGVVVGFPSGWAARSDLSALFPAAQYSGVNSALGVSGLNTTALADGVHTIAWVVTDNLGGADGIGSRYFTVSNGTAGVAGAHAALSLNAPVDAAAVLGRRGYDLTAPFRRLRVENGRPTIHGEELDRFELLLAGLKPRATDEGVTYAGYLQTSSGLMPLPIGSHLDPDTGVFTWQPGVAFIGPYDFAFVRCDSAACARTDVRSVLHPKTSGRVGPQVIIDTPAPAETHVARSFSSAEVAPGFSPAAEVVQPFLLAGWAIDLDTDIGTGVDTVHVWAYPADGRDPLWIGAAAYGGERPDVAAIFGDQFAKSGYGLRVQGLEPGTYDLAVFAWSTVQNRFVPAKVVRVTVRQAGAS